jgi:histidinol-phosphate aminotransferase
VSEYWSALVTGLQPYVPGEQPKLTQLIKLNTNENPYPPSPHALAAIKAETADTLRLYPDPNADELKQAIATYHELEPAQVFVGNGSDEVLAHVFQGLLKHSKPLLFPDISYSFYPVYCRLYQIEYKTLPLDADFDINIQDYKQPNGGIIFPNPNAPTGKLLGIDHIEKLLSENSGSVVVIDEAYIDFGGTSAIPLIKRFPNLLVVQTFSKSRSLAGLRVGFAVGDTKLIEALERIKNSFNSYPLDRLAIKGAVAALADKEHFETTRQNIMRTREWLSARLQQLDFEVLPSAANFIFVRHHTLAAEQIARHLREKAIIVRHFGAERINQFLRITIGTDAECQALADTLAAMMTAPSGDKAD